MPFINSARGSFGPQGKIKRAAVGGTFYPASSVAEVYNGGGPSDVYNVNFPGVGQRDAYINTSPSFGGGGGWVLVMRGNASETSGSGYNFEYGNSWWTDSANINLSSLRTGAYGSHAKDGTLMTSWTSASRILIDAGGYSGAFSDGQYRQMQFIFSGTNSPANLMFGTSNYLSSGPDWSTWRATFGHDRSDSPYFERYGSCSNSFYGCGDGRNGCGMPMMFGFQADDNPNDVNSGIGPNSAYCGGGGCWGFAQGCWMGSGGTVRIWAR